MIQLSIDILDNGYDAASNTSTATVLVTATYSDGSYNRNARGTLNINGVSYGFTASINGMEQDYGYETIYSQTVVIDRSVTDVVDCSATIDAGGSSGTISASGSLPLTGGSSGGDSGGDGGDDENEYRYVVRSTVGENTTIVVTGVGGNVLKRITQSSQVSVWTTDPYIRIYAYVLQPETYELATFTCAGKTEVPARGYYTVEGTTEYSSVTFSVVTEARPKARVHIDTGEGFSEHSCYIDNGEGWDLYAAHIDNGIGWEPCV